MQKFGVIGKVKLAISTDHIICTCVRFVSLVYCTGIYGINLGLGTLRLLTKRVGSYNVTHSIMA